MDRLVMIGVIVAVACGPTVRVDESGGEGSGEGDTTSTSAGPEDASSSVDTSSGGVDTSSGSEGSESGDPPVGGVELWDVLLPRLSSCPRLAATDDGGIAIVGNERFEDDVSIPHVVVFDDDGSVRTTFQGGHSQYDVATDVVAEPGGFVVVGQGDGAVVGWMQRWTNDGSIDVEVILGMDELGDRISDIERRDATSYWIVASDEDVGPSALFFRSFDEAPTSGTTLLADAFDLQIARAPNDGAYVSADAEVGTLSRFDGDGEMIWALDYTAPIDAVAHTSALASTVSGDAIVVGTDQGDADAHWIRRFDPDGTELWHAAVEVGAIQSGDRPLQVAVDENDAIFVVGSLQAEEGTDGFLAKYDESGAALWQTSWGAQRKFNVRSCDVVVTSDGPIVVAGTDFLAGEGPDRYWLRAFSP